MVEKLQNKSCKIEFIRTQFKPFSVKEARVYSR